MASKDPKDSPVSLKKNIIAALRSLSYKYYARKQARDLAKVAPATFECKSCGVYIYDGDKEFSKVDKIKGKRYIESKTKMDHIEPIVPVEGFKNGWDWNLYIHRMFVPVSGWQVLCPECHSKKTKTENQARKLTKDNKKGKLNPNEEILL